MVRKFLKSKIHRAIITDSNLDYVGSLTIDETIMEKAAILPNELVHIYNINNGARLETYVIKGQRGKKQIGLNGAAARLGEVGDKIIIVSYCLLNENEIKDHKPKVVIMGENNKFEQVLED
jgi:aspartate 1-decarboxylase